MAVEFSLCYKLSNDGQQSSAGAIILRDNLLKMTGRSADVYRTGKFTQITIPISQQAITSLDQFTEKVKQAIIATRPFTEENLKTLKWALRIDCQHNLAGIYQPVSAPKVIIHFKRNTNLFGIDAIIAEDVKELILLNIGKIKSNILGLCVLLKRGISLKISKNEVDAVKWVQLLDEFKQNELSISAVQTMLLKNGMKQFAKY